MKHLESKLQQHCVRWFDLQYPKLKQLLFAIPNGGKRGVVEAKIMKGEGVRAGVADLFLSVSKSECHGLYIEMKTEKGKQTDSQATFEQAVTAQGYQYHIIRTFEDFRVLIQGYLG